MSHEYGMKQAIRPLDVTVRRPMPSGSEPVQPADKPDISPPQSAAKTPQAFSDEVTRRPDVRAILEDLAQG